METLITLLAVGLFVGLPLLAASLAIVAALTLRGRVSRWMNTMAALVGSALVTVALCVEAIDRGGPALGPVFVVALMFILVWHLGRAHLAGSDLVRPRRDARERWAARIRRDAPVRL